MKATATRKFILPGGLAVLAGAAPFCHAVDVSIAPAWPGSLTIQTLAPNQATGERDVKLNRNNTQTIQVAAEFQIDKLTILVGESQDLLLTFDLVIFEVADVMATPLVQTGTELLRIPSVDVSSLAIPVDKTWVPLEFDLQGAEEITLAATSGTAGYAIQLADTGSADRPFKWRLAAGNLYGGGAMYTDGGVLNAGNDFVLAIQAVTNDTDGDGMPDAYEDANGLDKNINDAGGDLDGDLLSNIDEFTSGTDPQIQDTDGDGLNDKEELDGSKNPFGGVSTDPLDPDSDDDTVSDGDEVENGNGSVTDPNNPDTDGEGADDGREIAAGTNPNDPNSFPSGAGSFIALVSEQNGESSGVSGTHVTGIFFDEEVLCYTDRTHQYNGATVDGLPGALVGGDYVMTANDARDNANYVLTVTTDAPCSFFLLFDSRMAAPAWMTDGVDLDFLDTGTVVGIDESGNGVGPGVGINNTSRVYIAIDRNNGDAIEFSPGSYQFFERGGSGNNMYGVVATTPILDADGDGLPKEWEEANGLSDNDASGDNGAAGDPDADGLDNSGEFVANTDPLDSDTDDDNLNDGDEVSGALNPFPNPATDPLDADSDGDGLLDGDELDNSNGSVTDPNNPDTDGDSATDGLEVARGSDPTDPGSIPIAQFIASATEQNGEPEGISGTHLTNIFYGEDVLAYTDRTHQHNGATSAGLPPQLAGGDYIMTANDARDNANYQLNLTLKSTASLYVLFDNRFLNALPAWTADGAGVDLLDTGLDTGIDEGGDGVGPGNGINQTFSVLVAFDTTNGNTAALPPGTYSLFERGGSGGNMYGVVASTAIDLDRDGDGIPDFVEQAAGLNPNDGSGDNGPAGDSNHNTVPNGLELFYGLNPSAPGAAPALDVSGGILNQRGTPVTSIENIPDGVDFSVLFGRSKLLALLGLSVTVQFSSDMVTWFSSTDPGTVVADDGQVEVVKIQYPFFLPNGRKARFFRFLLN